MHDDQHGTAIISGAALLNALELVGKNIGKVKFVVNGAGASAISCCKIYIALGADVQQHFHVRQQGPDYSSAGPIWTSTSSEFARTRRTHVPGRGYGRMRMCLSAFPKAMCVNSDMVKSMANNPIVFAMANPDPEIAYEDAMAARPDVIMATGRSDYPNQVNNVLGFPYHLPRRAGCAGQGHQ